MAQGREEEALDFLTKYHGAGDSNDPVVVLECAEFKEQIEIDGADKRWWDYRGLFMTSSQRWRSAMVIMMGVAGQFSGNGLGYFNLQIYEAVGYDNYMQFVLNLANSFTSAVSAFRWLLCRRNVLYLTPTLYHPISLELAVVLCLQIGCPVVRPWSSVPLPAQSCWPSTVLSVPNGHMKILTTTTSLLVKEPSQLTSSSTSSTRLPTLPSRLSTPSSACKPTPELRVCPC